MGLIDFLLNGDYMPHGHCFLWRRDLLWMHAGGDVITGMAYLAIPAALVRLVRGREDLAFDWVFLMFALFIFFCGLTHLLDALNIWHGYYHLEGFSKVATAFVSLLTAFFVWRLLPRALLLPSQQDLLEKNRALETMRANLYEANQRLEARVAERTRELERLATSDPLTSVSNRRELMDRLQAEMQRVQRYQHPLSVLMIDLDYFKAINDTHGHQTGDRVLVALADLFRNSCRATDTIGRYGGEEFMIILPETAIEKGLTFAERLLERVREMPVEVDGESLSVTCSIGVAGAAAEETVGDLIDRADQALYSAKTLGRNRVAMAVTG